MKIQIRKLIIVITALAGLSIMSYLTFLHFTEKESFCNLSETVSCDVVTTSIYSEVFGIPISIMGGLFFIFVLYLSWRGSKESFYNLLFILTLLMLIPSLYFTMTEALFIEAFCILCESSKVLMLVILVAAYTGMSQKPQASLIVPIVIAGVVMSGVIYFAQTGTIVKRDYSELVSCLNEKGITYYKSFKCSNCRRFELIIGEAKKDLKQVECHPEGAGAQVELCLKKEIDKTPTFILEPGGSEIKRLVGLQQPKALADFAGCPLEEK